MKRMKSEDGISGIRFLLVGILFAFVAIFLYNISVKVFFITGHFPQVIYLALVMTPITLQLLEEGWKRSFPPAHGSPF